VAVTEVTIANALQAFPAGSSVKAYAASAQFIVPESGPPPGAIVSTNTVAASGELKVTNLVEGKYYVLACEVSAGVWRYMHVYLDLAGETIIVAFGSTGDIAVMTAGKGFRVKEGANAKMGTATLAAGKVTVANTSVTSESRIFLQRTGALGTAGVMSVTAVTPGVSFTVESKEATDTGTFNYEIKEPA